MLCVLPLIRLWMSRVKRGGAPNTSALHGVTAVPADLAFPVASGAQVAPVAQAVPAVLLTPVAAVTPLAPATSVAAAAPATGADFPFRTRWLRPLDEWGAFLVWELLQDLLVRALLCAFKTRPRGHFDSERFRRATILDLHKQWRTAHVDRLSDPNTVIEYLVAQGFARGPACLVHWLHERAWYVSGLMDQGRLAAELDVDDTTLPDDAALDLAKRIVRATVTECLTVHLAYCLSVMGECAGHDCCAPFHAEAPDLGPGLLSTEPLPGLLVCGESRRRGKRDKKKMRAQRPGRRDAFAPPGVPGHSALQLRHWLLNLVCDIVLSGHRAGKDLDGPRFKVLLSAQLNVHWHRFGKNTDAELVRLVHGALEGMLFRGARCLWDWFFVCAVTLFSTLPIERLAKQLTAAMGSRVPAASRARLQRSLVYEPLHWAFLATIGRTMHGRPRCPGIRCGRPYDGLPHETVDLEESCQMASQTAFEMLGVAESARLKEVGQESEVEDHTAPWLLEVPGMHPYPDSAPVSPGQVQASKAARPGPPGGSTIRDSEEHKQGQGSASSPRAVVQAGHAIEAGKHERRESHADARRGTLDAQALQALRPVVLEVSVYAIILGSFLGPDYAASDFPILFQAMVSEHVAESGDPVADSALAGAVRAARETGAFCVGPCLGQWLRAAGTQLFAVLDMPCLLAAVRNLPRAKVLGAVPRVAAAAVRVRHSLDALTHETKGPREEPSFMGRVEDALAHARSAGQASDETKQDYAQMYDHVYRAVDLVVDRVMDQVTLCHSPADSQSLDTARRRVCARSLGTGDRETVPGERTPAVQKAKKPAPFCGKAEASCVPQASTSSQRSTAPTVAQEAKAAGQNLAETKASTVAKHSAKTSGPRVRAPLPGQNILLPLLVSVVVAAHDAGTLHCVSWMNEALDLALKSYWHCWAGALAPGRSKRSATSRDAETPLHTLLRDNMVQCLEEGVVRGPRCLWRWLQVKGHAVLAKVPWESMAKAMGAKGRTLSQTETWTVLELLQKSLEDWRVACLGVHCVRNCAAADTESAWDSEPSRPSAAASAHV